LPAVRFVSDLNIDQPDVLDLARRLVDIDSTTGREGEVASLVADLLRTLGYVVDEQPVTDGRVNVFAHTGTDPVVVLSTHLDCVPPFFPSRVQAGRLYGRGACDAKGIAAAQIVAALRLCTDGESRVGLLFVAGEERGSDGAKAANLRAPGSVRFLVDGEPTDSRLGVATRGTVRVRLQATGRPAHSAYPERGESAIHTLLDALAIIKGLEWPVDPVLGRTTYHVGLISGGVAPNVLAPSAQAELMFRTVGDTAPIHDALEAVRHLVRIETLLEFPVAHLHTVEGFETASFSFGTDIPMLDRWGVPLLFGPGSIHVAHTDEEFVDIAELRASVDGYVAIARRLLAGL